MDEVNTGRVYTIEEIGKLEQELLEEQQAEAQAREGNPAGKTPSVRGSNATEFQNDNEFADYRLLETANFGALRTLAEVASRQPVLPITESPEIVNQNKVLNIIDPPKDLKVPTADNTTLSSLPTSKQNVLKEILKESFFGAGGDNDFITFLKQNLDTKFKNYSPVADMKEKLVSKFQTIYKIYFEDKTNKYQINRISKGYSGGISILEDYTICQDNGPLEIFADTCSFVNTPGTVMDPAFRKTSGPEIVNLLPALGNEMTLELSQIEHLSLNSVIAGSISMKRITQIVNEKNVEYFFVTIPIQYKNSRNETKMSTLKGKFLTEKAFLSKPLTAEDLEADEMGDLDMDYFAGNPVKNKDIFNILNALPDTNPKISDQDKVKIIKYLLAKEIGDTILVKWLKFLLEDNKVNEGDFTNTLVNTSDTVVWLRCITNKVGCIFTQRDPITKRSGSTIYPTAIMNNAQKALMASNYIQDLERQTIKNNIDVINEVKKIQQAIEAHLKTSKNPANLIFMGLTMPGKNIKFLNLILLYLIYRLEKYNDDLRKSLAITTNIETAKEIAKDGEFVLPFVKKGQEYRLKAGHNSGFLPNGKLAFNTSLFISGALETKRKEILSKLRRDPPLTEDELLRRDADTKLFEQITPLMMGGTRETLTKALAELDTPSKVKTYNEYFRTIQGILNGEYRITRSEKARFARKFFILRHLRLQLLKKSKYLTALKSSENPTNQHKGTDIIDAAVIYSNNKRVDTVKLPTPLLTNQTNLTSTNPTSYSSSFVVELFQLNYTSASTTNFLYWFVRTYMPSIFHAAISFKLAFKSFHAVTRLYLFRYLLQSYPITDFYKLDTPSQTVNDHFTQIYTYDIEEPTYDSTRQTYVFSDTVNTTILNETNELLAYAKYFYSNIRPESVPAHIKAFFDEIDTPTLSGENYSRFCNFIGDSTTLNRNLTTWTFSQLFTPTDYSMYEPVVQLGGDNETIRESDPRITAYIKEILNSNTNDFTCVMANEFYDFYYDLEHLRCIDNVHDYSTYTQRYTEALENADQFLSWSSDPFDLLRGNAFKQIIHTEYNTILQNQTTVKVSTGTRKLTKENLNRAFEQLRLQKTTPPEFPFLNEEPILSEFPVQPEPDNEVAPLVNAYGGRHKSRRTTKKQKKRV